MAQLSSLRLASWLLMGTALTLGIYAGSNFAFDLSSQGELAAAWDSGHHAAPSANGRSSSSPVDFGNTFQLQRPRLAVGQPLAKMTVPSVKWSGIVLEGNDDRVLSGGPGHQVGSAYPGEPDNMVISNHNTYSMQFSNLKAGDQVILDTDYGQFVYRISQTRVASATDKTITAHSARPLLTFTTCWPLWAGAFATQRYVITADQVKP